MVFPAETYKGVKKKCKKESLDKYRPRSKPAKEKKAWSGEVEREYLC